MYIDLYNADLGKLNLRLSITVKQITSPYIAKVLL